MTDSLFSDVREIEKEVARLEDEQRALQDISRKAFWKLIRIYRELQEVIPVCKCGEVPELRNRHRGRLIECMTPNCDLTTNYHDSAVDALAEWREIVK